MNNRFLVNQTMSRGLTLLLVLLASISLSGGVVVAAAAATTTTKTEMSAKQQAHLQLIKTKGDAEIARRLTKLNTLTAKIDGATKLTSSDNSVLSSEVTLTASGLTRLKDQLDNDTTVAAAIMDAKSIYSEYRVYALVAPKVNLVKVADDQQVVEGKLAALAKLINARLMAEQQAGKDVTSLQSELTDLNSKGSAALAISSKIESTVIGLQPSDFNSNHSVLSGDNTQLKTAHSDNMAAVTDARNIIAALQSM